MRLPMILTASAALLGAGDVAEFESPKDEPPSASLAPNEVSGENFHIQDPVHSDGLMHHYVVESRFGTFPAYGHDALKIVLHEVAALTQIDKISSEEVVLQSVARGIEEDAKTVFRVATNPIGVVLGVPTGISHLLGGYKAEAGEVGTEIQKTFSGDGTYSGSSSATAKAAAVASHAQDAATQYAERYVGLTAAERHWYEKLAVDPYTRNEVLRRAVRRLAKIDAAASFGVRFAPVAIPFAGEARRALDAIYKEDPAVLRKRRHEALASYGLTPVEIQRFENAILLSPTRQEVLVEAMKSLDGVEGRAELLRHASVLTSDDEMRVFLYSTGLLLHFHARTKLARILSGPRLPSAELPDGRVEVFGAFDALQWTEEVSAYERALRELSPAQAPGRELWLEGRVTPRAMFELTQLGWNVHEQTESALAQPPAS